MRTMYKQYRVKTWTEAVKYVCHNGGPRSSSKKLGRRV